MRGAAGASPSTSRAVEGIAASTSRPQHASGMSTSTTEPSPYQSHPRATRPPYDSHYRGESPCEGPQTSTLKRTGVDRRVTICHDTPCSPGVSRPLDEFRVRIVVGGVRAVRSGQEDPTTAPSLLGWNPNHCLLYTSPSPRDGLLHRMPSSA